MELNPVLIFGFLLYLVPFGIALAMPGWRSLFVLAVSLSSVLVWLYISLSNSDANGFGVIFALGFLSYLIGGLISGVTTRIIYILLARFKTQISLRLAIGIVGFLFLPSSIFAFYKWKQWQMRPVSESCLLKKHPVTIGGAIYYLPAAPYFIIWTDIGSIYLFSINEEIRTICEQTSHSSEPIHVINLSIDMIAGKFKNHPFCKLTSKQWLKNLCDSDFYWADKSYYPVQANISSPTEFDHRHMLAAYSYESFIDELERAKNNHHPLESTQIGIFNRYNNGYWVVRDGSWKNEAGQPFTFHCYDSGSTGNLYCSTSYRLNAGSQVSYDFRVTITDIEIIAKKVDENFHQIVADLKTP